MKVDPIIAVKDVEESSAWYQAVFDCRSMHGGTEFDVLIAKDGDIFICLHKWGEHDHPSMKKPSSTPGNGLILYFRTEHLTAIRQNIERMGYAVAEEIQMNPNSRKKEFSIIDPDGYHLTISEFHNYEG